MSDNDHATLSFTTPTGPARYVLTTEDLTVIYQAIRTASDTRDLLITTINRLYQAILAGTGQSLATLPDGRQLRPDDYALPTNQWQAIVTAVTARAQQWGTAAEVGLELVLNVMPDQYHDPDIAVPDLPLPDYRPVTHTIVMSRDAIDVLTDCRQHLDRLRLAYGDTSAFYLDALHSWDQALHLVLTINAGASTTVDKDDELSLIARTGSGLIYAVIFRPTRRRCTVIGCHIPIADDGTTPPDDDTPTAVHEHQPNYPLTGPQPGTWSLHS
jgi:hypothetical protein